MYSVVVLSHGDFTNGLKDTMMMIAGLQEHTYFISFRPSDSVEEFEKKVKIIYHSIPKEHQVLILSDLFGGTPSHIANALHLKYNDRVESISGVNLPMLLTAVLSKQMKLCDVVEKIIYEAKNGIKQLQVKGERNEEDE